MTYVRMIPDMTRMIPDIERLWTDKNLTTETQPRGFYFIMDQSFIQTWKFFQSFADISRTFGRLRKFTSSGVSKTKI